MLAALVLGLPAAAAELTASVDRVVVNLGEEITLTLSISGASQLRGGLSLPPVDGFSVRRAGTTTTIVNRRATYGYSFILTPLRAGTIEIPSFSLEVQGKTVESRPVQVRVVKGGEGEKELVVRVRAEKRKVHVGEAFCVDLTVGVGRGRVESFDAHCPWLKGTEGFRVFDPLDLSEKWQQAASAGRKLAEHTVLGIDGENCVVEAGQEEIEGSAYSTYTARRMFVAKEPGEYVLSPATARVGVVTGYRRERDPFFDDPFFGPSFFTRKKAVTKAIADASEEIKLTVEPLPAGEGRMSFGGVGQFTMAVEASPTEIRLGETITLKVTLSGRGDLDTLAEPSLADESGYIIGEPEIRKRYELEGRRFRGTVEFVRPMRPRSAGLTEIPELSLSYFDVEEEKYVTLRHPPIPIAVAKPESQPLVIAAGSPARGMKVVVSAEGLSDIARIDELDDHGRRLHAAPLGWALFLLPPAAFAGLAVCVRRARKLREDVAYRRRTKAPARALRSLGEAKGAQDVANVLAAYVADRINRGEGEMPSREAARILEERGLNELAREIEDVLSALEAARFAGGEGSVSRGEIRALLGRMEEQWRD